MDIINILPDSVANQIAAGEVVDRPAGAVKELLENSLDAGATRIDLVVKDAGRTLIQVVDNGCGMSDGDARLCFERHATSKIHRADDLFAIHTMGFRGEALASIAAIAHVELRTRQAESELGTELVIEGSQIVDQHPSACPYGTSLSVKNLFYNVPARRNFLKRDSVEFSHIEEVFRRITLIHYDVGFSLSHNGKPIYDLPGGSLLQRIVGLFGSAYKERLYAVEEQTDVVRIRGFVSRPEWNRRTRGEQYLFVNGRFIKHPGLSVAVEKAYAELIPEHTYPSYFIGLEVDPARIDVNIHPTKTEVKFVDESALFSILRSAVKKALGQFTLATQLSFDTPPEFDVVPAPAGYVPVPPSLDLDPTYTPFRQDEVRSRVAVGRDAFPREMVSALGADELPPLGAAIHKPPQSQCVQLQGKYIVAPISSGLALIHQSRAHERVLYERMLRHADGNTPRQTLVFPVQCHFSAADAELMSELLPDLQAYGLEVSPMGQQTFVVTATPTGMEEADLQAMLEELLTDYKGSTMTRHRSTSETLCASLARRMAVREGTVMQQEEMQQLVADLFACPMPEVTPHGKRIMQIIKPEELLR